MAERTYLGLVIYEIINESNLSQSAFVRECKARGYLYHKDKKKPQQFTQPKLSEWRRGVYSAPRELPAVIDRICGLPEEKWMRLAVAFAYGQEIPAADVEDLHEIRKLYLRALDSGQTRT